MQYASRFKVYRNFQLRFSKPQTDISVPQSDFRTIQMFSQIVFEQSCAVSSSLTGSNEFVVRDRDGLLGN